MKAPLQGNAPSAIRDAYVLTYRRGDVLLLKREHTGYRDGEWQPPAGKVLADESYEDAARRELLEETGLAAPELEFRHLLERRTPTGELWLGAFFEATTEGHAKNLEHEKHSELEWFDQGDLPATLSDYVRHALDQIERGRTYSRWRED